MPTPNHIANVIGASRAGFGSMISPARCWPDIISRCVWVLCLYLMGLNISNLQIADELSLSGVDAQAMTEHLRHGLAGPIPATKLKGKVEIDEVYIVAGHKAQPAAVATKRRPGRCRRLRGGARWRRTSRQSSV